MKRRTSSVRPITVTTDENAELVEEIVCSQEEFPGTHKSLREIARNVGISRSSVRRLVKRRKISQFKRMETPQMNNGTGIRRTIRLRNLAERFNRNPTLVEKFAIYDEKDFMLEVPTNIVNNTVYFKGKKGQVPDENLFHQTNKQSIKVMASACLIWNGTTKSFFNGCVVKVNAQAYKLHLQKEILPVVQRFYVHKNWIFVQGNAPSHRSNLVQDFLQEALSLSFIKTLGWPPSSPDCSPLDYYFWNKVK